ncbi:phosphatidyl inositol kinase [Kappamyces sp. JEL0829]|nr:phosphatidyl inositol kinase [Kappamyces sp. JEL0829]
MSHPYEPVAQSEEEFAQTDGHTSLLDVAPPLAESIPSLHRLDPQLIDCPVPPPTDSVIPPLPGLENLVPPVTPVSSLQFVDILNSVQDAIDHGIYPTRIVKGSSGSYFCRNREGVIVGVFKPKNEEPYGNLNPKWTKWLHRTCLPCCFGRSCIIPNLGYITEAAASYVDRRLGLNVVPRTEIVYLSSPSFHYSFQERWKHRIFNTPLPKKIGSFQLFLNGFVDSTTFFNEGYQRLNQIATNNPESHPLEWTDQTRSDFQHGFERLVILDYLIRNTDRGSDNWMIKSQTLPQASSSATLDSSSDSGDSPSKARICRVQVAAIDNGLAFPHQHPNRVRSYPFGWLLLPIVHTPFSKSTADQYLPYLTSAAWWQETLHGLEALFSLDRDFKPFMWERQKAVVRGQGYNLMDALSLCRSRDLSPFDLVQSPPVIIHEDATDEDEPVVGHFIEDDESLATARRFLMRQQINFRRVRQRIEINLRRALFADC